MMRTLIIGIALVALAGLSWLGYRGLPPTTPPLSSPGSENGEGSIEAVTVVAEGLEIPWDIAFLPEGEGMLVTERPGRVALIGTDGSKTNIKVAGVKRGGEGGLLGILLHPRFTDNRLVYLYMSAPGEGGRTQNRVMRYRYEGGALAEERVIVSGIPGAIYHDGGRMAFGPDGLLYITTGDATDADIAQDLDSLGGKILRLRDDGSLPADNPFGTAIYSYGHRNPQGLAWDSAGRLWETEHGRSGQQSGLDEINLIRPGANYGWPVVEGDVARARPPLGSRGYLGARERGHRRRPPLLRRAPGRGALRGAA